MKRLIVAVLVCAGCWAGQVRAEPDCALGQRYLDLAHERVAASEFDDAALFLKHAVEACPSYEAYQALGELEAQSPQREDQAHAVDDFIAAYPLAPTDAARARSLLSYARLLNQDGDPQNAYRVIKAAQALDPANAEIVALSSQIQQRVDNPTKESISRGLWNSLYKPLRLASASTPAGTARPVNDSGGAAPPVAADPRTSLSQGPAIAIKINFDTGSTLADEQTRSHIALLAHTLADPGHADQRFVFVGHADSRGIEANNVILSKRRAEAIYQSVILLEPSLRGRIDITGKGSAEPVALGNDEQSLRENRRLQVLLK